MALPAPIACVTGIARSSYLQQASQGYPNPVKGPDFPARMSLSPSPASRERVTDYCNR